MDALAVMILTFAALYFLAVLAGFAYFQGGKNGAHKRLWYPRYVIFMALSFMLLFVLPLPEAPSSGEAPRFSGQHLPDIDLPLLLISGTFVAVMAYRNIKRTRFCLQCGALNRRRLFTPVHFCRRCGGDLAKISVPD